MQAIPQLEQILKTALMLQNCKSDFTFQGLLIPLKNSGIHIGKTTASLSNFLASTKSAISSLIKKKEIKCLRHINWKVIVASMPLKDMLV